MARKAKKERAKKKSPPEQDLSSLEHDLLRVLMDTSPDQIYFKDANHRFIMLNDATAKRLGVSIEEAVGRTDFDFYPKDVAKEFYNDEKSIIKTGKPLINKMEKAGSAGKETWNFSTKIPIFDKKGKVVGVAGISREFTEWKQMEEKLVFENDLFHSLLDNIPDAIYFKDKENRFIKVSKSQIKTLGTTQNNVIGKTDFDFFPEEQAKKMYEDDQLVMKNEEPVINKIEKVTKADGKDRWVSATKIPRYDRNGNVVGTLGISRDLTEYWILWKRMEKLGTP